jgi:hypothetical protein
MRVDVSADTGMGGGAAKGLSAGEDGDVGECR